MNRSRRSKTISLPLPPDLIEVDSHDGYWAPRGVATSSGGCISPVCQFAGKMQGASSTSFLLGRGSS